MNQRWKTMTALAATVCFFIMLTRTSFADLPTPSPPGLSNSGTPIPQVPIDTKSNASPDAAFNAPSNSSLNYQQQELQAKPHQRSVNASPAYSGSKIDLPQKPTAFVLSSPRETVPKLSDFIQQVKPYCLNINPSQKSQSSSEQLLRSLCELCKSLEEGPNSKTKLGKAFQETVSQYNKLSEQVLIEHPEWLNKPPPPFLQETQNFLKKLGDSYTQFR